MGPDNDRRPWTVRTGQGQCRLWSGPCSDCLLSEILTRCDGTQAWKLALHLFWLAVAFADADEPEEVANAASRMLDMSADLTGDRTTRRARLVLVRLKSYADVPQVRELLTRSPMSV